MSLFNLYNEIEKRNTKNLIPLKAGRIGAVSSISEAKGWEYRERILRGRNYQIIERNPI